MAGPWDEWLVIIDMQRVFATPDSPWFTPAFKGACEQITFLLPLFGKRVIFTRFIPPEHIDGSWDAYYRKWEFATDRTDARLWRLVVPWQDRPTLDTHRFSKWGIKLRRITGPSPRLVLCGVSTDCCVMATALGAVDDGAFVRVVADACGAKTPALHEGALSLLSGRAPQLVISSAREERGRLDADERIAADEGDMGW
jgi:nicotinamidase-related amidase